MPATASAGHEQLFAIHLRDELGKHDLIELLPTGAARHLGLERLGLRKHAVNVGVAAHNHLWRAIAEHIERAPSRPFGHVAVRVRLELGAAEIDVDDVAAIQWHYALTIAFTGVQVNWDSWMDPAFRQRRNMLALRSVHDGRARNYLSHPGDCRGCKLKKQCTRAPFRKIARDINEKARDHARSFTGIPEFDQSSNQRTADLWARELFER